MLIGTQVHAAAVAQAGQAVLAGQVLQLLVGLREAFTQAGNAAHGFHFGLQHGLGHKFAHEIVTTRLDGSHQVFNRV